MNRILLLGLVVLYGLAAYAAVVQRPKRTVDAVHLEDAPNVAAYPSDKRNKASAGSKELETSKFQRKPRAVEVPFISFENDTLAQMISDALTTTTETTTTEEPTTVQTTQTTTKKPSKIYRQHSHHKSVHHHESPTPHKHSVTFLGLEIPYPVFGK